MPPTQTALRLLLAASAALTTACIRTEFTSTLTTYEGSPEVFIDRRPTRPYMSVGIIEVVAPQTANLQDIIRAAAIKGRQSRCDLVVDRAIHHAGSSAAPRWTASTDDLAPLRRRTSAPDVADAFPAAPHGASPWLAFGSVPSYQPPIVVSPPNHREFICGVYRTGKASPSPSSGPLFCQQHTLPCGACPP